MHPFCDGDPELETELTGCYRGQVDESYFYVIVWGVLLLNK